MQAFRSIIIALLLITTMFGQNLQTGDTAPGFNQKANNGKQYNLDTLTSHSIVVLYFYPKAMTPGCTKQACALRDSLPDLNKMGITVLGVSTDSLSALNIFTEKEKLNFPLLSDVDGILSKAYGVYNAERGMAKRSSFIIGKNRKLMGVIPKVDVNTHIQEILAIVNKK